MVWSTHVSLIRGDRNVVHGAVTIVEDITEKQIAHDLGGKIGMKVASFLVASSDGFTAEEKQEFLEMTSSRSRLEKGVRSLRRILERVRLTKQIKQIISGNGHVLKLAEGLE